MADPTQPLPNFRDAPLDKPADAPASEAAADRPQSQKSAQKGASDAPPVDLKALTDRTLHFLATASNETIGACLVGLGAGTYLVLGRVGLLLIGVVGGVVLHATWEGHVHGGDGESKTQTPEARKRELGVNVAQRVLDWRDSRRKDQEKDTDGEGDLDVKLFSGKELDFSDFRPETAAALTELTDAVIRDYVKYAQSKPLLYSSNAMQMVVLAHSPHRRLIPQLVPPDPDCLPDLRVLAPFPQAARRQLCGFYYALVLVHDYNLPRALQRHHGIPRRQRQRRC